MGDGEWLDQVLTPVAEPNAAFVEPSAPHSQRLWFMGFLVGGLVTGAAAVFGLMGPSVGYLILDPLTRHYPGLLMASLGLLIVAAIVMRPLPAWGNVLRVAAIIGLGLVLAAVAFIAALTVMDGQTRTASPDGRSILVVSEGSDMIDTVWNVTVQQSSPGLARTWNLACFNDDNPDYGLASIRWVSSTLVEAQTGSGHTFTITIDPSNSQPSSTISSGC